MFKTERYDLILKIISKKKLASTKLLCKETYCSPSTIRRDLIELENMGLINYSKGVASIQLPLNCDFPYKFRENENIEEKKIICKLAKTFIKDSYSIFLDSSSTVYYICNFLRRTSNLTIATNSISIASSVSQFNNIKLYVSGGYVKNCSNSIIGESATNFIKDFNADLTILSCHGLDCDGVYETDQNQVVIKQQMMKNSKSTIILCDSTKFNKSFFYRLCNFNNIDAIITNKKPDNKFMNIINTYDCDIIF